jgi:hypothetical protein
MRFGMVMILAVFCINALLIWSTSSPHKKEESSLMIQQVTRGSVLPTPMDQSKQHVRSFATPNNDADDEKLRIRSFMEEHARLLREMESPAPRASSIERGHE